MVQGDHFYHSFHRMLGSAVYRECFLILRGPRRGTTQGGAGGSPSQDHWISHCALSPVGCCALRVCVCVCVCVCVLGGRRWPHTAALDEAGLNLLRMHRTRTAVPLPLNNYTGNWGALWSTRQPSIWTELPAEAAASPPACHCIQKRSGHPGRRRADQAQPLLPSLPPPISPFQKRGSPHGYQRRKRGRDKSGVNRSTPL